jgi:DNA-binding transcriptional ArsR family regulator
MSSGNFKHDLFTQFARVGKALSNGNRLELMEYIAQGERSVDELAKVSGLTVANTSQHLQQLRQGKSTPQGTSLVLLMFLSPN